MLLKVVAFGILFIPEARIFFKDFQLIMDFLYARIKLCLISVGAFWKSFFFDNRELNIS